jgi:hypothetical protein
MDVLDEEVKGFQLRLKGILKEFLEQDRIEVYGNLRIVVTSFDKIAFLKGNTIYVNIRVRRCPDFVLTIYNPKMLGGTTEDGPGRIARSSIPAFRAGDPGSNPGRGKGLGGGQFRSVFHQF